MPGWPLHHICTPSAPIHGKVVITFARVFGVDYRWSLCLSTALMFFKQLFGLCFRWPLRLRNCTKTQSGLHLKLHGLFALLTLGLTLCYYTNRQSIAPPTVVWSWTMEALGMTLDSKLFTPVLVSYVLMQTAGWFEKHLVEEHNSILNSVCHNKMLKKIQIQWVWSLFFLLTPLNWVTGQSFCFHGATRAQTLWLSLPNPFFSGPTPQPSSP